MAQRESSGRDATCDTLLALPADQSDELEERLRQVLPTKDPGLEGARLWLTGQSVSSRATLLVASQSAARDVLPASLYLPQVVIGDPVGRTMSAEQLRFSLAELVTLRPLVADGAVVLYPPCIGQDASGLFGSAEALWGQDLARWGQTLLRELPQGQTGEVAWAIAADIVAGAAFDLDLTAVGRWATAVQPALGAAGLRTSRLCEALVPAFPGLSSLDVVAVRQSSSALAAVRPALEQVADLLPDDAQRARRRAPEMLREILEPSVEQLRRETRRSPTLAAAVGASWTVAAVGVDVAAHALSPGSVMAAAGAQVALLWSWAARVRSGRQDESAMRVLRTLAAPAPARRWGAETR